MTYYPDYDPPDAIIFSDLHIRRSAPICRKDNFIEAQEEKYEWLNGLRTHFNDPPMLCAGDVFNKWRVDPWEISLALDWLPEGLIAIPGNHDLPAHNIERVLHSGIGVLWACCHIQMPISERQEYGYSQNIINELSFHVYGFPFKEPLIPLNEQDTYYPKSKKRNIALVHHFVYKGRKPFPGAETGVTSLMKKLEGYDLIITGDNHIPFHHRRGNQVLINPGSFTRQSAIQWDHEPRVYLWYAEKNTFRYLKVPIRKEVISREHLEEIEVREHRISSFIKRLEEDLDIGVSFDANVKEMVRAVKKRGLNPIVVKKIYAAMGWGSYNE